MKKVLAALGATAGFIGLASFAIFFVETVGSGNFSWPTLPAGNLTADISANVPQGTVATPPTDVPDAPAPPPLIAPVADTVTAEPLVQAPTPTPLPPPAPVLTAIGDTSPATSTEATATIEVTTTTPTPPPTPLSIQEPQIAGSGDDLSLPYDESNFRGDQNWQATWGTLGTTWSGAMSLAAGAGTTGGAVYLKNSGSWSAYTLNATIDWTQGVTFGLMADYQDASNYVLCEFTKTGPGIITVKLKQYLGGAESDLTQGTAVTWDGTATGIPVSMKVSGIYGTCSFNGTSVTNTAGPGNSPIGVAPQGSIGFTVNDPTPGTAGIIVDSVAVANGS